MKKLFITLIICLLFLSVPVSLLWGIEEDIEYDFWTIDDILDDTINNTENSEKRIYLETIELYWSADTYVPFGYQGRKLPTKESWVFVEVYLEISGGNPKHLKYSWFLDDIFQESKSGYGRDSFKFGVRRLKSASHTVLLKVFNENRSFLVEKSITIPITNPELVLYSKESSTSAKSFDIISDKETSFLALPYFFSIDSIKDLEFKWTFSDKSVKESSLTANIFGLKIINKKVGGSLEETLKVIATNKRRDDQGAQKTIKVNIY